MDELSQEQLDDPDFGLASASLFELNSDFYSLQPWAYLRFRLRNLVLSAGRGLELREMFRQGVEVGGFKVEDRTYEPLDEMGDDEALAQQAFVALETEVLLHHSAETLLRLYLAHRDSDCPWLSMARERNFKRFKKSVRTLREELTSADCEDELAELFFGTSDRQTLDPVPDEDLWTELTANCREWLGWFAKYMLDSNAYNAAKHGLGVWPQNLELKVQIDGAIDFLDGAGPCLEYLHTNRNSDGRNHWRRTTKWIQPDRYFGCIHIACYLIHRLWSVASVRHGDLDLFELELTVFPNPAEMLGQSEMVLTTFSRSLKYYENPGDADADSAA